MARRWLLWLASAQLVGCASMNMKKQCYANGVCRIEQNGQVSWSGPPEEVAKMQEAQEGRKQALAQVDKAYAEAPKRSESEPIRLVLIGPTADAPDLVSLFFLGGAAGSQVGHTVASLSGWHGLAAAGIGFAVLSLVIR